MNIRGTLTERFFDHKIDHPDNRRLIAVFNSGGIIMFFDHEMANATAAELKKHVPGLSNRFVAMAWDPIPNWFKGFLALSLIQLAGCLILGL